MTSSCVLLSFWYCSKLASLPNLNLSEFWKQVLESTDHINSCKPVSRSDPSYKETLEFIEKIKAHSRGVSARPEEQSK